MNNLPQPGTLTFLIRLWPVWFAGRRVWRAVLIRLPQNEHHGFASLEDLFQFLISQTQSNSERAEADKNTKRSE